MRYTLTIELDSLDALTVLVRTLTQAPIPGATIQPAVAPVAAGIPTVHQGPPPCPVGHGPMALKSPKPGQTWPPFWRCNTCGAKTEIGA